jgi:ABC-type nitrate/sulfonate/bicarbonate transport system permease component
MTTLPTPVAQPRAVRRRRAQPRIATRRWRVGVRALSLLVVLGLWQAYGTDHVFTLPPPTDVIPAMRRAITSEDLLGRTLSTIASILVGFGVSVLIGVAVGSLIPLFPWARNTLDPLVDAAYAMPVTMLIPIAGVYLGLGFVGRVFIVVTFAAPVIVINVATGVREVPTALLEAARSFGARSLAIWRAVIFPSALPFIFAGLAIAVTRAVQGAIAAELLLSVVNLGHLMKTAGSTYDTPLLMAVILWTLLLGYGAYMASVAWENRALGWRESGHGS